MDTSIWLNLANMTDWNIVDRKPTINIKELAKNQAEVNIFNESNSLPEGSTFQKLEKVNVTILGGDTKSKNIVLFKVPVVLAFLVLTLICISIICLIQRKRQNNRRQRRRAPVPRTQSVNNRDATIANDQRPHTSQELQVEVKNAINYWIHQTGHDDKTEPLPESGTLDQVNEKIIQMTASGAIHYCQEENGNCAERIVLVHGDERDFTG